MIPVNSQICHTVPKSQSREIRFLAQPDTGSNSDEVVDVDALKEADVSKSNPILCQSVMGGKDQLRLDVLV